MRFFETMSTKTCKDIYVQTLIGLFYQSGDHEQKFRNTSGVPRASEKEGQVRLDHSPAPTQLALLSPICTCSKRLKAGNAP